MDNLKKMIEIAKETINANDDIKDEDYVQLIATNGMEADPIKNAFYLGFYRAIKKKKKSLFQNKEISYDDFVTIKNSTTALSRINVSLLMISELLNDRNYNDKTETLSDMVFLLLERLENIQEELMTIKEINNEVEHSC